MISFLKKNNLLRFIGVFVGIQFLYFSIYTFILYGVLTWLHLIYIIVFMSSYAILLYAYKNYFWHVGLYILLAVIYIWALLNFVHFKVFNNFLSISFSQLTTFQGGMKDLVIGFSTMVPWYLYILTGIFLGASIWYSYRSVKKHRYEILDSFEFTKKFTYRDRVKIAFGYLLLLSMINISGVAVMEYFEKNPKAAWWDLRTQIIDYGIIGHTYSKFIGSIFPVDPVFAEQNPYFSTEDQNLSRLEQIQFMNGLDVNAYSQNPVRTRILHSMKDYEKLNFLMIQLESVSSWAVQNNPSPMPFLRSLMDRNITVSEFYPNSCETINAELAANCSFLPNSHEPISFSHKENNFTCLPEILSQEHGYYTKYYHANLASFWDRDILTSGFGFENANFTPHYKQKAYDGVVFKDAINELTTIQDPFYAYITTFTTHSPHNEELREYYNTRYGNVLGNFDGELNEELYSGVELDESGVRDYFSFLTATDTALKDLFTQLEETGLAENTVVMIYNDHRFYNFEGDNHLETFYKYNKSPFVMVLPETIEAEVAEYASHVDIAPTILHLLEQDQYQPRQKFLGTSLLQEQRQDHVVNKCLSKIFYINKNMLVQGNYETQQYQAVPLQNTVSQEYMLKWKMYPHFYSVLTDEILFNDEL